MPVITFRGLEDARNAWNESAGSARKSWINGLSLGWFQGKIAGKPRTNRWGKAMVSRRFSLKPIQ
jgi:hypothetical protein